MPAPSAIRAAPQGLREKLGRVTGVRALIVTLLFGSAVVLNLDDLGTLTEPPYLALSLLISLTLVASVVYGMAVRYGVELTPVAHAQTLGDALLAGGLVLITGGSDSAFLFLFFLSIITTSFVIGRSGALFSASACSVAYAVVVLAQEGHLVGLSALNLMVTPFGRAAAYVPIVHIASFYAVALLAGHLAERLGQVGTELERRRLDVRELEALNENIVNSVAGGLCTTALDGRIIAFNPAAERITGWLRSAVLGRRLDSVLPALATALRDASQSRERNARPVELERTNDGQRRFLDVSVAPLHDATHRQGGHILSFNDVTELRRLQDVLGRQRRLAAIGQLSASIAHEIRNPLASISGSIEMLRDADRFDEGERRLVDIAVREIDRLNTLIADFLSYARPRSLNRRPVEARTVLEECVVLARQDPHLARDVTFVLQLPDDDRLLLEADPDSLREILWNLTRNAAEATGPGGTVTLSAKRAGRAVAAGVAICVRDDGQGLSEEARRRLFEPFFTTKPNGTGLGLATTHRAVEAHGGLIWTEDVDEGPGTAFWIVLPGPRGATSEQRVVADPTSTAQHLAPSLDQLLDALSVSSDRDTVWGEDD